MRKLSLTITGLALIGGLLSFPAEASAATTQQHQTTFSKSTNNTSVYKPKKRKSKKSRHTCDAYHHG